MNGFEVVRLIKESMKSLNTDRGFAIACTSNVDLNYKIECYRSGMDYYVNKPFDLFEINAIIKYFQL